MSTIGKENIFSNSKEEFSLPKVSLLGESTDSSGRLVSFKLKASDMKRFTVTTPNKKTAGSTASRSAAKGMKFELDFAPNSSGSSSSSRNRKKEKQSSDEELDLNGNPSTNPDNISHSKKKTNLAINLNVALDMQDSSDSDSVNKSSSDLGKKAPMDTPQEIKVAVRMRPLSESEKVAQGKSINHIIMKDQKILVVPKNDCFDCNYILDSSDPEMFNFASQEIVYRKMGHPLLDYAFQGYNTCLFAYGQSGSGKTYTMLGTEENPGIIPRFINELFRRIQSSREVEYSVHINFMEIYQEKIYDLLADDIDSFGKNLRVREHPETGPYVEDLSMFTVETAEKAMDLLQSGLNRRAIASTSSNEKSSRSHTIFNIILVQKKKLEMDDSNAVNETSCVSKINLVDLAGSERISSSTLERFRESGAINKSLLTLGKVINQLAENTNNPKNVQHVPYRDSVLTYLLKESLGGNSRTSMIATISPAKAHLDETLSTLRYASTAKKIINIVRINEDPREQYICHLKRQISHLKKQVSQGVQNNGESIPNDVVPSTPKPGGCCKTLKNGLTDLKKLKAIALKRKELCNDLKKFTMRNSLNIAYQSGHSEPFEHKIVDKLKSVLESVRRADFMRDLPDLKKELKSMWTQDDKNGIKETEVKKIGTLKNEMFLKKLETINKPEKEEKKIESPKIETVHQNIIEENGPEKEKEIELETEKKLESEIEEPKIATEKSKPENEPEPEKKSENPEPEPEKVNKGLEPENYWNFDKDEQEQTRAKELFNGDGDEVGLQTEQKKEEDDVDDEKENTVAIGKTEKESPPKQTESEPKWKEKAAHFTQQQPVTKVNSKKDRKARKKRGQWDDEDDEEDVPDWTKPDDSNNDYKDAKQSLSFSMDKGKNSNAATGSQDDDNEDEDKDDGFKSAKPLSKKQQRQLKRENRKKGK